MFALLCTLFIYGPSSKSSTFIFLFYFYFFHFRGTTFICKVYFYNHSMKVFLVFYNVHTYHLFYGLTKLQKRYLTCVYFLLVSWFSNIESNFLLKFKNYPKLPNIWSALIQICSCIIRALASNGTERLQHLLSYSFIKCTFMSEMDMSFASW